MADTLDPERRARRRRSDARRSIDAILTAARTVLSERPDASMEDIATTAGVSRQTVYAHFPSRDALIAALIHAAGVETVAAYDAAGLDTLPPPDALRRYLDISWQLIRGYSFLLAPALARIPQPGGDDPHDAGTARLEQLLRRGRHTGDFTDTLPVTWLAAAVIGLVRTAAEQVAAGSLTPSQAADMLQKSAQRLCAPDTQPL
ncbi:TetR/AcrR family transcriptional regulator [Spirillospora sp. NPDC048911]|uniref:TetR/AcrR family transcriptional regulator n=1 Tax=Spirillospora sp. NPDC048911 TaxID=3364527 RepID=UPI00371BF6CC